MVCFSSLPEAGDPNWMQLQNQLLDTINQFDDSVTVQPSDAQAECFKVSSDKAAAEAESDTVGKKCGGAVQFLSDLQTILGCWYKTGFALNGHEVWKLHDDDLQDGCEAAYIYYWNGVEWGYDNEMDGWYCANAVVPMSASKANSIKQIASAKNSSELKIYAYSSGTGHEYIGFPQSFVIPATNQVECGCVQVQSALVHFQMETDSLSLLVQGLEAELGDKRGGSQALGEQLRGPMVTAYTVAPGWFERCAGLIRLVQAGRHDLAEQLSSELLSSRMKRKIAELPPLSSYCKMSVSGADRAHHGLCVP